SLPYTTLFRSPEPREGDARAPGAALRSRARAAGRGASRGAKCSGWDGRAGGEDPHLQLPREPRHRPPHQADDAPSRPGAAGRPGRVHRRAHRRRAAARVGRVTVAEVLRGATEYLAARRVDSPRVDAELLLSRALGLERIELYTQHD